MGRAERGEGAQPRPRRGRRGRAARGWDPAQWTPDEIVLTCEHAGREVPREFAGLFRGRGELLRSHRGWDIGALRLTEHLAAALGVRPHLVTVTRLVVDVNRSVGSRTLFSEVMRGMDEAGRERIVEAYWRPHRSAVENEVGSHVKAGRRVLHLSVHTFTPVMKGRERKVDIGLLFDPGRRGERAVADAWVERMKERAPELLIRRNLPYRGTSDGFTTHLRRRFSAERYAGIEIELSNRIAGGEAGSAARRRALDVITQALLETLGRSSAR